MHFQRQNQARESLLGSSTWSKHKGHWASCQESEDPFFRTKTIALLSWLHGENHQHRIPASSWKWMARVMCSPGTRNWGQTRPGPGSIPAAAQLGMPGLLLPPSAHRKLNRLCWVQTELFFPCPFIQRFSLAYTWNHTLFNMFKTSGATNAIRGNEDHSALRKSLLSYTNIWVNYLLEKSNQLISRLSLEDHRKTWLLNEDTHNPSYAIKLTSQEEQIFKQ